MTRDVAIKAQGEWEAAESEARCARVIADQKLARFRDYLQELIDNNPQSLDDCWVMHHAICTLNMSHDEIRLRNLEAWKKRFRYPVVKLSK